jgi:hypothetical protein
VRLMPSTAPAFRQTLGRLRVRLQKLRRPLVASLRKPALRLRWVVFDFATGIKTIELADGSFHEELFEAEPVAQLALSTLPHAVSDLFDPVATGSVETAR